MSLLYWCCVDRSSEELGDSRKYPYHTTDGCLEFQGQGGFFELEIQRHGGILTIGILKAWGVLDLGFHRRQTRAYSLKTLILWTFKISSQI